MRTVDLNRLREMVLRNQQQGQPTPTDPSRKVHVDSEGGIRVGGTDRDEANRPLSEVHQGTFAFGRGGR
ncbi:MAG TPA: hypothetical protein PK313_14880 [Myxococcota bacterium]|nr:hypothetical protein [Myxococcota bacterium]